MNSFIFDLVFDPFAEYGAFTHEPCPRAMLWRSMSTIIPRQYRCGVKIFTKSYRVGDPVATCWTYGAGDE